jgi:hypothetical protein
MSRYALSVHPSAGGGKLKSARVQVFDGVIGALRRESSSVLSDQETVLKEASS